MTQDVTQEQDQRRDYDIAIIGAGPGGYSTALRAAELGLSVALIDRDAVVGGTCLNRGCIPSKALITATHAIGTIRHARELGINASVDGILLAALYSPVWTAAILSPRDFFLGLAAFVALMFWKVSPWIVVIACGVAGGIFL